MKTLLKLVLLAFLACAIVAALVVTLRVGPVPRLEVQPSAKAIGPRTSLRVVASAAGRGIAGVRVEVEQEGVTAVVARRAVRPLAAWSLSGRAQPATELAVDVSTKALPRLQEGEATLRVVVERAPTWLLHPAPLVQELRQPVLLRPPTLSLVSAQHYVAQGGAGVVVYRVSATATRDGVRAGSWFFPGAPLPGANGERFAFFGVPWDLADGAAIRLQAEDAGGNVAELAFVDRFTPKPPAHDRIELRDDFLARVVPEIMAETPGLGDRGSLLANYLQLNRELRRQNAAELVRLAQRSASRFLWKRPFLPPHGAKVMSAFADRRTYVYGGREVDEQTHLGFDLASTARSPVAAANDGVVLLARYFGIYGNTVLLDHGYGLLTLYSHLSSIRVSEGQSLARGAILGLSGRTGLAGGDHLHFSTLVRGLPVTPIEWWDAHWLRDRITSKLAPALVLEGD